MRTVELVLAAVLLFFAVLQYNDPDGLYWFAVYALAAAWCLLAVWRPERIAGSTAVRAALAVTLVAFVVGFARLAPTIDANWIHVEEAREALGYLICAVATFSAWMAARRAVGAASGTPA